MPLVTHQRPVQSYDLGYVQTPSPLKSQTCPQLLCLHSASGPALMQQAMKTTRSQGCTRLTNQLAFPAPLLALQWHYLAVFEAVQSATFSASGTRCKTVVFQTGLQGTMLTHHNLRCMLTTCCLCMFGRYMWPWRVPSLLSSASPFFEASRKVGAHVLVQHREVHKVQLLQSRQMPADIPPTNRAVLLWRRCMAPLAM